jgi:hypothetical protein
VLAEEPYRSGTRLFWIVDNGSLYRGAAAMQRLQQVDARIILVHTPVHASWLNQVEIYFSIIQQKVLTPNDCADLDAPTPVGLLRRAFQSKPNAFSVEI